MSIPPYPGPYPEANSGARPPIKYVWPKRIAVILAGLAMLGGIGFGVKSLLDGDDTATTSQETVQSAPPVPAPSQAPQSSVPQASPGQAVAQAPMRLESAITDSTGALSDGQSAEVKAAVKSLQAARDVRLWVVYVDAFDTPPVEWARKTRSLTKMGNRDAVLAVATEQRKYAFLVAPDAANGSEQAVEDMRRNDIEPKLRDSDWAGAAVAAAKALQALS